MDRAGQPFFPEGKGYSVVGAPGRAPVKPAASCGSRSEHPGSEPARPMLFAQKLLAPGSQPKRLGKVNPVLDTGPPAEPGVYLKEIKRQFRVGIPCLTVVTINWL